jgi:hypothetical protein
MPPLATTMSRSCQHGWCHQPGAQSACKA